MKRKSIRRLFCLLLCAAMVIAMVPSVLAANPDAMTDISGHWAEDNIRWAMEQGLFNGMSETEFAPNHTMTRGMFVTVLGRMAAVWPGDYDDWYTGNLFTDVPANAYYAPYVAWAVRCGITNGTSDTTFSPDMPVTREQLATFIVRYSTVANAALTQVGDTVPGFDDAWLISSYAQESVEIMRSTGLIIGSIGDDGLCYFRPQGNATRAEACTVFRRLSNSLVYSNDPVVEPYGLWLTPATSANLNMGESTQLYATVLPSNSYNKHVTWVSDSPNVASVTLNGTVYANAPGTATIYAYTWNGHYQTCRVTVNPEKTLSYANESYNEKCMRIFGRVVSDPRNVYSSDAEARSHMTTISVKVWDFADSSRTIKLTRTMYLTVHKNIAASVEAAFAEIYNGPERFPIYSMGAYRYDPGSEHFSGLAIDINPNENYQCTIDGTPLTGSYWKPGIDPYSIPLDGDVATAFARYGFTQGAYWRSSRDYMHFSYFAT